MNRVCHFCHGLDVDDETMKEEHETYHIAPDARKPIVLSDADKAVMKVLKRDMGKFPLNYETVALLGKSDKWTPEKVLRAIREEEDPGFAEFKRLQKMKQDLDVVRRKIFYEKDGKQCIDSTAVKEYLRLNADYLRLMKQ